MKAMYSIDQPMAPLWLMYPHICRYSIGWRMGVGEAYLNEFERWYTALGMEEQNRYRHMFPEPKGWQGWYTVDCKDYDLYDDGYLLWNKEGRMNYSLERLHQEFSQGQKGDFLFFWGHQPAPDGQATQSCLSQWWQAEFTVWTDRYRCMEQYMMAEKARIFEDREILGQIMQCTEPKQMKELGRKVQNFDEAMWERRRYSVVLNGNFAKFLQNDALKGFLLQTGEKVLVEASPYDRIWGIGMAAGDAAAGNPMAWKGQNLLGFALMEVRDELKRVCQYESRLNLKELRERFV